MLRLQSGDLFLAQVREDLDILGGVSIAYVQPELIEFIRRSIPIFLVVYKDSSRNYYAYGTADWENGVYSGGINGPAAVSYTHLEDAPAVQSAKAERPSVLAKLKAPLSQPCAEDKIKRRDKEER